MPKKIDYNNKLVLAPMVRIGALPMRLLALDYGADLVYTEELIDWKLLRTKRVVNDVLEAVDFVDPSDGTVVFRTSKREKERVILQLGTCDSKRALQIARLVENDVAGIDINMGCPKEFSIKGGMGAALMRQPELACEILETLVQNTNLSISCKIRIFPDRQDTLELVHRLVKTGIAAIAIHGRTINERPQHENHSDMINFLREHVDIPVIANGGSNEIEKFSDIEKFRKATGCDSVMLARAAQWNCSIFRKEGMLEIEEIIDAYLRYAIDFDNSPSNTKYVVQNILRELQETPKGKKFLECQSLQQICDVFDLGEYYRKKQMEFLDRGFYGRSTITPGDETTESSAKRQKLDACYDHVIEHKCVFLRRNFHVNSLPKTLLINFMHKKRAENPRYNTLQKNKLFKSFVTVDDKTYSSSYWEKNKKYAEQSAALACLYELNLVDREQHTKDGSVLLI